MAEVKTRKTRKSAAKFLREIEDDQQRSYMGYDTPPRLRTIVTRDWRMTMSGGNDWGELYNLTNDPHEIDNLWDDPDHRQVRGELFEQLSRRQTELADQSPMPTARA